MIRRNIVPTDRDQRVVKWSLIAAAFALSVGSVAEATLARHAEDRAADTARTVQVEAQQSAAIQG